MRLSACQAELERGRTKISAGTDTETKVGAERGPQGASLAAAAVGAALIAAAIYASLSGREWVFAGLAGAAGLALWRRAFLGDLPTAPLLIDAAAFALFAYQRNDSLAFWQLAGSWGDAMRLDVADASVAYCVYLGGSLSALLGDARPLRPIEALGLVAVPFLFKLVVVLGADWHMAEIGGLVPLLAAFPAKVFVGRVVVLFIMNEAALQLLSLIGVGRLARQPSLHCADIRAVGLRRADAAIRQFRPDRRLADRKNPLRRAVRGAGRSGTMGRRLFRHRPRARLVQRAAAVARQRASQFQRAARPAARSTAAYSCCSFSPFRRRCASAAWSPSCSRMRASSRRSPARVAFPLAQTLIGSADGTAPFIGRLRAAYGDLRAWARGIVIGVGCWWAFVGDLVHADPLSRFCWAFVIGAFAYAGVDALFDLARIVDGKRRRMQSVRVYWLGVLLGGFVAGALGWYFDAAQVAVVWNKFWAYADANYRNTGRALGDFVTYPIFNKYGMVNLGEVAGGVQAALRRVGFRRHQLVVRRAAVLDQRIFLTAMLDRSLRPIRGLSRRGRAGAGRTGGAG